VTNLLPIRLRLALVDLIEPRDEEVGARWTLGPTWYDDHRCDDEGLVPYYDSGDRSEDARSNVVPDGARRWAETVIAKTTDYRVTGWDDTVPQLEKEHHQIEILTIGGTQTTHPIPIIYTVPNGRDARQIRYRLGDVDDVISIRQPEHGDVTVHIPVRAIATLTHIVTRHPVENG
jgi:hypothetical protein